MYIFIVNKVAGNGNGPNIFKQIKQDSLFENIESRSFLTEFPGHAEILTRQAAKMYEAKIQSIVVIGGDGTINEVLNGLINYPTIPIAFIPAGSGNDFARGYHIKGSPQDIFRNIVNGNSINFWPGAYVLNQRNGATDYFANSIGFGFDAEIVKIANKSWYKKWLNRWGLGTLTYVIALIQLLRSFRPKKIDLIIDGKRKTLESVWMVTVANHPFYGGGMRIIPSAKTHQHKFPILIVQNISHWKVLALFITVFWGGHVKFKEVSIVQAQSLQIISKTLIEFQVDGQSGSCYSCEINKDKQSRVINGITKRKLFS